MVSVAAFRASLKFPERLNSVLNNKLENLRLATHGQNMQNSRSRSHSKHGIKGIYYDPKQKKWRAQIRVNCKKIYLGRFLTKEEAHKAYCTAAELYHKDFARFD